MDFVVVAKKGCRHSITVLSRKRWKNYGAATVARLAGPDDTYSGLSTPDDQSAAWARIVVSRQRAQAAE